MHSCLLVDNDVWNDFPDVFDHTSGTGGIGECTYCCLFTQSLSLWGKLIVFFDLPKSILNDIVNSQSFARSKTWMGENNISAW